MLFNFFYREYAALMEALNELKEVNVEVPQLESQPIAEQQVRDDRPTWPSTWPTDDDFL